MYEARNRSTRLKVLAGVLAAGIAAVALLAATASWWHRRQDDQRGDRRKPADAGTSRRWTPSLFTAKTGIKVKYTILDEGKLREGHDARCRLGWQGLDAVMIGMYETPQFGAAGLLQDLTPQAKADTAYGYKRSDPRSAQRALGERQAVRVAVLCGVVVPDVSQGRPPGERG